MFKKYKLHHRKHTGKLIHHRHTHYPALFLIMLVAGLLMIMTDRIAVADDLLVTAAVPAPLPAGAPVFTSPSEGDVVTNHTVRFTGTCPVITPAVIIALYEGSTLLGSAACQADGTFEVTADLSEGVHTIVATVYTITNQAGQSSAPLHITYQPPANPGVPAHPTIPTNPTVPGTPSQPTTNPSLAPSAPLDIIAEKPYLTYARNVTGEWRGRFAGGTPPYRVTIDWGDGKKNTYTVSGNDLQVYSHAYSGRINRTMTITVEDNGGSSLTRRYAVQYTGPASSGHRTDNLAGFLDGTPQNPLLTGIFIYLCLLAVMLMMWRYEHTHYPHSVIGVPIYYPWQKKAKKLKPRH